MGKVKIISLLFSLIITATNLFAQSVDDGKKFLYYERFNSAKDIFTKLVNANPGNIDAAYWLGQTYLGMEDTASAQALYQKTLQANPNNPLMMVAVGEIELMQNKTNDARNRFETAISLTKGKDANVLNAIGRANVDAKAGDVTYAIEKLKLAAEKDKKNPDIFINLGDAYRKITDGANAQISYQNALALDAKNARANFMIGRLYQTQGFAQEQYYMKYYNDAIAQDPNFAPVYVWLYDYYYRRDVNKSRDYLNKYIGMSDADPKNCYYQASILYASQLYKESITKSDECITAGGANPYPNLYGLKAYAYDKLGDSANAKTFFDTYFQKQNPEKLGPNDYATYAKILLKYPENDSLAFTYIDKAVELDTLQANKESYISDIASSYLAQKDYGKAGNLYTKLLSVKKDYGKIDLYNAGYNDYKGANYAEGDSIFGVYTTKYPDDILGWYMRGIINSTVDSTGAQGLAKPYYDKVIELGEVSTDSSKVKSQLITSYRYNVAYYYTTKNDIPKALSYVEKTLALDPANEAALQNKKALEGVIANRDRKSEVTKEKTPTTKAKTTSTKAKVKKK
ncbi:MAG: tetratricopeptide repeat protein [Ginsengibacter sp.]